MKLMSFNIRCANDPDGHSIPERAPRVAEMLRAYAPDIVGFQEYHVRWDASWHLVEDPAYGQLKVDRGDGEGLVLWWRKDKFCVPEQGHFWFADDPRMPSVERDEKYHKPRICAWMRLQDRQSGKVFAYMNVHYGFGPEGHIKNAKLLESFAEKLACPVVIAGDFNMSPGTPGYLAMTARFTDVNAAAANAEEFTYHGYGLCEPRLLDYCFVQGGVKPVSCEILRDSFAGKYPSDHYPILMQLEI